MFFSPRPATRTRRPTALYERSFSNYYGLEWTTETRSTRQNRNRLRGGRVRVCGGGCRGGRWDEFHTYNVRSILLTYHVQSTNGVECEYHLEIILGRGVPCGGGGGGGGLRRVVCFQPRAPPRSDIGKLHGRGGPDLQKCFESMSS